MSLTSDQLAAKQIIEKLSSLYTLVHEIEKRRQQNELSINALKNYEDKVPQNPGIVKSLYRTALNVAEQEEELLRDALRKIAEIRNIKNERRIKSRMVFNEETMRMTSWFQIMQNHADTMPLYVGKPGEKPPPLCGAIPPEPNYIAKVGDLVTGFAETKEGQPQWILAEVIIYNHSTQQYELEDVLTEKDEKKRKTVHKKYVVPLPLMRANPVTNPEALHRQGSKVWALYPTTSCLYIAVVSKVPKKHTDQYEVLFYDASYPEGFAPPIPVAQRYLVAFKRKHLS